jgi:hypothetical protein
MTWETISIKTSGNRGAKYGDEWWTVPAVSVTKGGLTFNQKFQEAFDCHVGSRILIHFDKEGHRLGFKIANGSDELLGSGTLRLSGKSNTGSKGTAISLACKASLINRIIDCMGYAYRAHLNAGERLIEMSLDPKNRCK